MNNFAPDKIKCNQQQNDTYSSHTRHADASCSLCAKRISHWS